MRHQETQVQPQKSKRGHSACSRMSNLPALPEGAFLTCFRGWRAFGFLRQSGPGGIGGRSTSHLLYGPRYFEWGCTIKLNKLMIGGYQGLYLLAFTSFNASSASRKTGLHCCTISAQRKREIGLVLKLFLGSCRKCKPMLTHLLHNVYIYIYIYI